MSKLFFQVIWSTLLAGSAMATVVLQDSFDNNSGTLAGRTPDTGTATWIASANLTIANGVLMTKSSAISSGWLALPDVASGEVVRVSAVIVGNVALNTQYIGIGLTTNASALYLRGAPYVTLKHGGTVGEDRGFFNIYGGLGNANQIDQNPYLTEAGGYATNLNARNTATFEYYTATGDMLAWLVSENGTTVTQYNGSVNYNGVAGAAIPVDLINYLGVQFTTGAIDTSGNPAYLDNLSVEIVPENPGSNTFAEAVVSDSVSLTIPAGNWTVNGAAISILQSKRFFICGAGTDTVTNEPLQLSVEAPGGFWGGTELQGPATHGSINALDSLRADTLTVRGAPGGAVLAQGNDYLLSASYAQLGLGTNTALTSTNVVYASYDYNVQRLDSVVLNEDGEVEYKQGTAGTSSIIPPVISTNSIRLLNIFRPYGADALASEHLFFIDGNDAGIITGSTPGRIPNTLQKLQNGDPATIVCWGDSVTVGADIADQSTCYVEQFRTALGVRFSPAQINLHNISIGGTKSIQWLYDGNYPGFPAVDPVLCDFDRILALHPDLVTIEFVNDTALTAEELAWSYDQILTQLSAAGAEVILITPHFINPKAMGQTGVLRPVENRPYVGFLHMLAETENVALADAASRWEQVWKQGIPHITLLANHYNHPDANGDRFFVQELMKCFE